MIKQRIAGPSGGRSRGARAILLYVVGDKAIFLHLFKKADKANLEPQELEEFVEAAKYLGTLSERQLDQLVTERKWRKLE